VKPLPRRFAAAPALAAAAFFAVAASAQTPAPDTSRDGLPGKAVFDARCAICHLNPDTTRATAVETLRTYPADRVRAALVSGVMKSKGADLSDEELDQVVAYLAADPAAAPSAAK
jgi:mono/diheme cytochrome c family protein